eukprot:Awhi_evm2s15133
MVSTIGAMKVPLYQPKYDYLTLFEAHVAERPLQLADGSINCIIDGVDRGFHCLMRHKNDLHCHGSYENCDVTTRSGQGRYETGSDDC